MELEKNENENGPDFKELQPPEGKTVLLGLVKLTPWTPVRSFYGMFALFLILYLIKKFLGYPFFHAIQATGISQAEALEYYERYKYSQFVALFVSAPFIGAIFDRYGRRFTVLLLIITTSVILTLERFVITSASAMTLVHITTAVMCRVLLQPPMLADYIDTKSTGIVCALFSLVPYLGTRLGNFLIETFITKENLHEEYTNIYIFFVIILALAIVIAFFTIFDTGYPQEEAVRATLERSPILIFSIVNFAKWYVVRSPWLLASTLLGLKRGFQTNMYTFEIWIDHLDHEHSSQIFGELLTYSIPLKILVYLIIGLILDKRFDLRILLVGGSINLIGVIVQLTANDPHSWVTILSWLLQNFGHTTVSLFQLVLLCHVTHPRRRGRVFGIFASILIFGRICGYRVIIQRLFAFSKYTPCILMSAVMLASMVVVSLFYVSHKRGRKRLQLLDLQLITSESRA
eukprot:TRINITY_DN1465_c0_g1_i9.p1 TRINITY_DN1465_c0_g1~~TRINITY_DN1465_c0_g1_i9.p1  ORF type:complete len:460 (+),score=41.78 TRINITY_DN1465_c0_g1_i9:72-1451(+)